MGFAGIDAKKWGESWESFPKAPSLPSSSRLLSKAKTFLRLHNLGERTGSEVEEEGWGRFPRAIINIFVGSLLLLCVGEVKAHCICKMGLEKSHLLG